MMVRFMNMYIGIDLGTSAVKLLLANARGEILNTVTEEYPLYFPHPGWSEQDPGDWKAAVLRGVLRLTDGFDKSKVRGIGCGGQMHGLVVLDKDDNVLSFPPIINGSLTTVTTETHNLFIDVTGFDRKAVKGALDIVCTALAERGGKIESVTMHSGNVTFQSPDFTQIGRAHV